MPYSESAEHGQTKEILKQKLAEWFSGIVLKEYKVAGHEADVYGVTKDGVAIHIEVVWTSDRFHPNLNSLLTSDAAVRGMIFSDKALQKYSEEYEKTRLEQLKKLVFLTEAFRAQPVLANDNDYLERIHAALLECLHKSPPGKEVQRARSSWYINETIANQIIDELKPEWKAYSLAAQLCLLEEEFTFAPQQIEPTQGLDPNLIPSQRHYENLDDLLWEDSRKLIRVYGRFFAPFGIQKEKESLVDFIWNPCYSDSLETQVLRVHLISESLRVESSLGPRLGADNWQREDLFMVGRIERHEEWQPLVMEPLFIYPSKKQSEDFHVSLMARVAKAHDLHESAFESLSDRFGLEKALAVNDLLKNKLQNILKESCWNRPLESLWMMSAAISGISRIIELSAQSHEQKLESALSEVILSRHIHTSIPETRDYLSYRLTQTRVENQILEREDKIVRDIADTLGLHEPLDLKGLVLYMELVQEVFNNIGQTVLIDKQWDSRIRRYAVTVSVQTIGGQKELLKLKMFNEDITCLERLIEEMGSIS